MARRLVASAPGFEAAFAAFLKEPRGPDVDVDAVAAKIVGEVKSQGMPALQRHTEALDRTAGDAEAICVSAQDIDEAVRQCAPDDLAALGLAARRLRAYHARQVPHDHHFVDDDGVALGAR